MHAGRYAHYTLFLVLFLLVKQIPLWGQADKSRQIQLSAVDSTVILSRISQTLPFKTKYPDSAQQIFSQTLAESRQSGYVKGIVLSLIELGYIHIGKGMATEALKYLYQALSFQPAPAYRAYIYNGIANAYNTLGAFKMAVPFYLKALELIEAHPADNVIPALNIRYNLIVLLCNTRQYDKALTQINRAIPAARAEPEQYAEVYGMLLNAASVCYYNLGYNIGTDSLHPKAYLDSFIKYSEASLEQGRKYHLPNIVIQALSNQGAIFISENMPERAIGSLLRAEALAKEHAISNSMQMAVYRILAKAYLQEKQYGEAEKYFLLCLEKTTAIPKEQLFLYDDLASFYYATGRYRKAYEYLEAYQTLSDSLAGKEVALEVNELETKYRTAEKDRQITEDKLTISNQEKKLAQKNFWIISGFSGIVIIALLGVWRSTYLRHRFTLKQLQAKTEGEEAERQRLAQELHDGINSQIAGINSFLYTLAEKHPGIHKDEVFTAMDHALQQTSSDIRKVARNLLPVSFEGKGLAAHIRAFVRNLTADKDIETDFQAYGDVDTISETLALNVYRIIQELLHNVIRHAAATEVIILLHREGSLLTLTVEDNGKGMDDNGSQQGVGLQNIAARVKAHEGRLIIESKAGKGTVVTVNFPVS